MYADQYSYEDAEDARVQCEIDAHYEDEYWAALHDGWREEADRRVVIEYVNEHYPFATGWRREELIEAGEDAFTTVADPYRCEDPRELLLSRDAELEIGAALAAKWREQCYWRRAMSHPALPAVVRVGRRAGPRPIPPAAAPASGVARRPGRRL